MNLSPRLLKTLLGILLLMIVALSLPAATSVWFLNFANANLARAAALPVDAPARVTLLAQASAQLAQAQALAPNPRIDLAMARGWLENTQPQQAVTRLQLTGELLRGDLIAQFIWGNAEWSLGNPAAAWSHWREAGAMDYFMQAALRYLLSDQWRQAEESARIAIGITPAVPLAHYFLGEALSRQSVKDAQAMSELKRAQELIGNRDNELLSSILTRQGEILAEQAKSEQAIALFEQARQVAPSDARPRTAYARLVLKTDPMAAEQLLMQVVADSPWYIDAYISLADLAESRGDLAGAEKWYQTGLTQTANDARLLFPLGEFYARQKKYGAAKETLARALQSETRADVLLAISGALNQVDPK